MLRFRDLDHRYEEIGNPGQQWTGVTTLISKFKSKFDNNIAYKNSADITSKWYGIDPLEIQRIWKAEADRSTTLGSWYHHKMEMSEITGIQCCPMIDEWKYAGDQKLIEGIHPEYLLYHPEYKVCGQADRLEVVGNILNCRDYKSNKKIETEGFRGKKMLSPLDHLDECHFNTYALQLSMYTYIGLHHNKHLKPGTLEIYHVVFENSGQDKWGYPITAVDKEGDYIVKEVKVIPVPYLEKECEAILNSL